MILPHRLLPALLPLWFHACLDGAIQEYSFTGTIERMAPALEVFFEDGAAVVGKLQVDTTTAAEEPLNPDADREAIASLQLSLGNLRVQADGGAVTSSATSQSAASLGLNVHFTPANALNARHRSSLLEILNPAIAGSDWTLAALDLDFDPVALGDLERSSASAQIVLRGQLTLASNASAVEAGAEPRIDFIVTGKKRRRSALDENAIASMQGAFWGVGGELEVPELYDPEFEGELSSIGTDEGDDLDTIGLIPEPGTFGLFTALGLFAAIGCRRHR